LNSHEDLSATIQKEIISLISIEGMYQGDRPSDSPVILLVVTLFQFADSEAIQNPRVFAHPKHSSVKYRMRKNDQDNHIPQEKFLIL